MRNAVVWKIGNHVIVCGDSTNNDVVSLALGNNDADIIVFDPPFEKTSLYTAIPKKQISTKLLVFWDSKRFASAITSAVALGWKPYAEFIWDTVTGWLIKDYPLIQHRTCGVFGDSIHWNREADKVISTGKHFTSVFRYPNSQCTDSAYQKPVEWFSSMFAGLNGKIVLDMFGGSGVTLIACQRLGISARVIEIDRTLCEQMIIRIEKLTGLKAIQQ